MNNKKAFRCMIQLWVSVLGFFMLSRIVCDGKVMEYPPWLLDSTLKMNIAIDTGKLKISFTNTGDKSRAISSTLFNEDYILSNVLSVGFIDPNSPRQKEDMFRVYADGVIGMNSEVYTVSPVIIRPNDSKNIEIDLIKVIYNVRNEKMNHYLNSDLVMLNLYINIRLNDIGSDSKCFLRYGIPHLKITRNSENSSIME